MGVNLENKILLSNLDSLYKKMKYLSTKMTSFSTNINVEYDKYMSEVFNIMDMLNLEYICDTKIEHRNIKNIKDVNKHYEEEILDYIVYNVRKHMLNDMTISEVDVFNDFDNLDATNYCDMASIKVSIECATLKIKSQRMKIIPGYSSTVDLFEGCGYHYFNIVTIGMKKFIVDCTYKQFFKVDKSSFERLGVPLISPPFPGLFMQTDKRKKVALEILKKGYIELTDDNLKHYLDGFTISFRNGLYYEEVGEAIYETNYSCEDYIRFLNGIGSQLQNEGLKVLGYQEYPLKNYKFNFKK